MFSNSDPLARDSRFSIDEALRDIWRTDLLAAAQKIAALRGVLGDALKEPIQRIVADPLVVAEFKAELDS